MDRGVFSLCDDLVESAKIGIDIFRGVFWTDPDGAGQGIVDG